MTHSENSDMRDRFWKLVSPFIFQVKGTGSENIGCILPCNDISCSSLSIHLAKADFFSVVWFYLSVYLWFHLLLQG